jgi:hypothetical protein
MNINKIKYVDEIDILNKNLKTNKKIILKNKIIKYLSKNLSNLNEIIADVELKDKNHVLIKCVFNE